MGLGFVVNILRDGILQILLLSAPILLVEHGGRPHHLHPPGDHVDPGADADLRAQDRRDSGVLMLLGPWMFTSLAEFTARLFERIPEMRG